MLIFVFEIQVKGIHLSVIGRVLVKHLALMTRSVQ